MALFRHLSWFFKAHWRTYLLAMTMLAGVALLNTAVPWLVGNSIDKMIAASDFTTEVKLQLLALLGMGLLIYLLRFGWRLILFGTSYRLGGLLRQRFYQRLTRLGPAFFSQHGTGDLMARATNDIDAVELAAGEGVLSGFDGLLTFILVLIMMFSLIDWRLTLVALIPFPLMGYGFYRISIAVHQHFHQSLERFSELNDKTQEALSGIRLIKAMGREEAESALFNTIAAKAAHSNYQVSRSEAMFEPVIYLALTGALLLTLGYGGYLIWIAELSVGQLTSFTIYMGQLIWPMWAFGWLMNIVERGSAAFNRVDALLNEPDSIPDSGQRPPLNAGLQVRNLSFAYPNNPEQPVLQQVSFNLPRGKVLGIVGPTGAGKTTLAALLMRQWEAAPGLIQLGELPLQELALDQLRSSFASVPQDGFLFSISIADNIALGRPDASREQVRQAARIAALDEDIRRFPDGYDTLVGERGLTLSGGQRQRLTIARALLCEAPILVLDDALSAVDVHTEQRILGYLQTELQEQSAIIISHRLSSVEHADEILVLNHGHVSERGQHAELLQQDGWYSRMWTYQQMEASLNEI
ncbi:ABC transporter ATP-binding protein [Marinobacterium jannaschii]|uniref:ABC transporter ATP-binding protein n=1 Tax=Marinobacterium jannaschii TaxID=64970 RepID=UPI0004838440|nr:ABC transporter transmembrane domain-containing protein [Marinobacterium jannaschii]